MQHGRAVIRKDDRPGQAGEVQANARPASPGTCTLQTEDRRTTGQRVREILASNAYIAEIYQLLQKEGYTGSEGACQLREANSARFANQPEAVSALEFSPGQRCGRLNWGE